MATRRGKNKYSTFKTVFQAKSPTLDAFEHRWALQLPQLSPGRGGGQNSGAKGDSQAAEIWSDPSFQVGRSRAWDQALKGQANSEG